MAPMPRRAQAALVDVAASAVTTEAAIAASVFLSAVPDPGVLEIVLAFVGGFALYHFVFATLVGQTLGRRWAGLSIARGGTVGPLPWWLAGCRVLIGTGAAALLGLGYLAGLGRTGRTWVDEVTATTVVAAAPVPANWFWATAAVVVACSVSFTLALVLIMGG